MCFRARLRSNKAGRMTAAEPKRITVHRMQALPGISILIGIRLPQSISLDILQFLTNTLNEWWQTSVFWVELKCIATKAERWEAGDVPRTSLPLLVLPPALCPPDCRCSPTCNGWNGPGITILETQELFPNSSKQKGNKQLYELSVYAQLQLLFYRWYACLPPSWKWWEWDLFEIASLPNTPRNLPFQRILWQMKLYSQPSFCKMNTGVFSLKRA